MYKKKLYIRNFTFKWQKCLTLEDNFAQVIKSPKKLFNFSNYNLTLGEVGVAFNREHDSRAAKSNTAQQGKDYSRSFDRS